MIQTASVSLNKIGIAHNDIKLSQYHAVAAGWCLMASYRLWRADIVEVNHRLDQLSVKKKGLQLGFMYCFHVNLFRLQADSWSRRQSALTRSASRITMPIRETYYADVSRIHIVVGDAILLRSITVWISCLQKRNTRSQQQPSFGILVQRISIFCLQKPKTKKSTRLVFICCFSTRCGVWYMHKTPSAGWGRWQIVLASLTPQVRMRDSKTTNHATAKSNFMFEVLFCTCFLSTKKWSMHWKQIVFLVTWRETNEWVNESIV